jgi:3-deoxy-manno-octulosonate cytidylyltransferase (CMP-KDO synthetase)
MKCIFTSEKHPNHIHRVHEVAEKIKANLYVCINGDEPMLSSEIIKKAVPGRYDRKKVFVAGLMRDFEDPAEVIDFAKLKIVTNANGEAIYMSRAPIPYPRGSLMFKYKKYVGVECFNKKALDFFVNAEKGVLEVIEDIDHLRFIENGIRIAFTRIQSDSISVDTPKDAEKVRLMMKKKLSKRLKP